MCNGLRGHKVLRAALSLPAERELARARDEHARLSSLYKDVCWYSFEIMCKSWQEPWHVSWGRSGIVLYGSRTLQIGNSESGYFPVYFDGLLSDAPPLPPEVIKVEVNEAWRAVLFWQDQIHAAEEWAPGGGDYLHLLRRTSVPTEWSRRRDRAVEVSRSISKRVSDGV